MSLGGGGGIAGIPTVIQFTGELFGSYRVFSGSPEYRFYRSSAGPLAESDTPFVTNATLPYEPLTVRYGDMTWWLAVSYYNGVIDSGFFPIGPNGETSMEITIAGTGLAGTQPPDAPLDWHLAVNPDGTVTIQAVYIKGNAPLAEQFTWSATNDGSDPPAPIYNAIDLTPTVSPYAGYWTITSDGISVMELTLPAQANGTTIKAKVATVRQVVYGNSYVGLVSTYVTKSVTVDTVGPTAAADGATWPGRSPEDF